MRMKKERSGCVSSSSSSSRLMKKRNSDDLENEIAELLPELKTRMDILYPALWGFKKKRSAIAVYSSSSTDQSPPSKPTKAAAASPLTPLSFPFSDHDSDDPTTITKRSKESGVKDREEVTKDNNSLHQEVKNVESFLDRMKNYNLKLKERKQKLSVGPPNQDVSLMANRTALVSTSGGYDVGPTGIPDLNIPLEESVEYRSDEGLDVNVVMANNRAMAAQARKNRRLICRNKNPIPTNKNHR